jgi:hypothetical protein
MMSTAKGGLSMTSTASRAGIPALTIQVIGAGFGRTGTLSLREALVRLGFAPCDHMLENFERPQRFALWAEALRRKQTGEPIDWRPLLNGYQAIVDWPGAYFWRELTTAHPAAKVILTDRDPEHWYESMLRTVYTLRGGAGLEVPGDIIWNRTFDRRFTDREHALATFLTHNQAVRETIAGDRLLIFEVKEGWEPLCAFLGMPVPELEPFPHLNDAALFHEQFG